MRTTTFHSIESIASADDARDDDNVVPNAAKARQFAAEERALARFKAGDKPGGRAAWAAAEQWGQLAMSAWLLEEIERGVPAAAGKLQRQRVALGIAALGDQRLP